MPNTKILGYVVTHDDGAVMVWGAGYDQHGGGRCLWFGNEGTVFRSRRAANRAVQQTIAERRRWLRSLTERTQPLEEDFFVKPGRYRVWCLKGQAL